jgi:SAM-dependent methyltransferase
VPDSIAFDRAAEYYDRSRATDPLTLRETIDVLAREFTGRGRVLEIGVGTGALALPLSDRGIPMAGLDLSMPMMSKLIEKAGGTAPLPLVRGDATRLPFRDDSLGGAYCRWVLHLIPDWRGAVAELCRVVRPGGVIVTEPGGFTGGWREMWLRFVDLLGERIRPVGLDWVGDHEELDAAFAAGGATRRDLPTVVTRNDSTLRHYFQELEDRLFSWTWRVPPEELMPAIAEVRAWAERQHPDLDTPFEPDSPILWRAYDLGSVGWGGADRPVL